MAEPFVFLSETSSETKLRRTAIYDTRVHAQAELPAVCESAIAGGAEWLHLN